MRKITIPHLVFSSLYFILALFTILMLALTSFTPDFKHMFRLTTQPFGVYFGISTILLTCGVIVSLFNIVRIYYSHLPKLYSAMISFALLVFVLLLYYELFVMRRTYFEPFSFEDSLKLVQEDAFSKSLYQMFVDYACYILFVICPAAIYLLNLSFDKSIKFGKILQLTQPSFNVMMGVLFGFAVSPFFKSGIMGYFDLALLVLGLGLILYCCVKRSRYFDSYELFNLFLLLVCVLIIMFSSHSFVDGESYFEVRKAFYALVLFGWCSVWMMKLTIRR
ncbi:hypothetical protein [Helicobacter sp.]|uniref:hypothetical protein n=1 Tax=Helicobacter sp. TaxID=218 RepID=UPI0019C6A50A|nr:hypothetical protein [Helicobacter sp.]MBD5165322.1 hypothetical protein [Helicobacter sp.]